MTNFQIYKNELTRLINKASNGGGWEITFTNKEDLGNSLARCTYNIMGRWVRFSICDKNNNQRSTSDIKKTARHEFGHFILCRFDTLAKARFISEDELDEESEAISRIFEKLL